MKRRKVLAGMGALAAGGAAAMGTGAFSQATAQRGFELSIRPDTQNPYLDFKPTSPYAEYENNMFKLSFTDNGNGGEGVPSRATTRLEEVFEIQNKGTNPVYVWIPSFLSNQNPKTEPGPASVQFLVEDDEAPSGWKYDSSATDCSGSAVDVDAVDISWPADVHPANKPSNPVPEIGTSPGCEDGRVLANYKGLRYPGGSFRVGAGGSQRLDVRFTVSNPRNSPDNFDVSFVVKADADNQPDSTDDWKL